ncbi:MAG: hypothetical protein WBP81_13650 [Solirubrobacteraceae bacterium]
MKAAPTGGCTPCSSRGLDAAGDHFDLLNNGQPISHSGLDSVRPDIVFSHNTPYVSWHETQGGATTTFVGHFEGDPANPVFKIDTGSIPTTVPVTSDAGISDVRQPVASTCPADPFTQDGAACPANAVGTPFFAFTNTTNGPRALFAQAYQPENAQTAPASAVAVGQATLGGSVNSAGAPPRAGAGRVRPDDQLRHEHGGSIPRPVGDPDGVQRGGDRPARGDAALSRGRDQRLRDLRRPRRDGKHPGDTSATSAAVWQRPHVDRPRQDQR